MNGLHVRICTRDDRDEVTHELGVRAAIIAARRTFQIPRNALTLAGFGFRNAYCQQVPRNARRFPNAIHLWKNDIAYFTFRQPRGKPLTGFGDVQIIDKVNAHRDVDYVCLHAGLSVLMENVQLINRPVIEVA